MIKAMSITEWAEQHSFKTASCPYMKPILDQLEKGGIDRVVIKSIQPTYTQLQFYALMNFLGLEVEDDE